MSYLLVRVERHDRQLLVYQPDTDRDRGHAWPAHRRELGYITAEERVGLFRWEQPTAFVKISK